MTLEHQPHAASLMHYKRLGKALSGNGNGMRVMGNSAWQ